MAVRDALLGILSLGPAYGLQLHAELGVRAPHRAKTNVGQVYGTLDRLTTAGLVSHQGLTDDGLPLYALTEAGREESVKWLAGESLTALPEWADVQDIVLISSSVGAELASSLVSRINTFLASTNNSGENSVALPPTQLPAQYLNEQAQLRYVESVALWLTDVQAANIPVQPGYALGRPKRGRPAKN